MNRNLMMVELSSIRGAKFIGIETDTEPRMKKTNNPYYGKIRKRSRTNCQINFNYDKAVEKRLEKENKSKDLFEKGESWHMPIIRIDGTLTPFCVHKDNPDELYLRARILHTEGEYYDALTGKLIEKALLEPFLIKSSSNNQGTDDKIIVNTINLNNIRKLTLNGVTNEIAR